MLEKFRERASMEKLGSSEIVFVGWRDVREHTAKMVNATQQVSWMWLWFNIPLNQIC